MFGEKSKILLHTMVSLKWSLPPNCSIEASLDPSHQIPVKQHPNTGIAELRENYL